ncbi:MAG: Na+/H+ antiporter subunit E [Pseudomonadota bacterium]
MARLIILTIALAGLWLLLSGYFDKPLLLGFGVASVALAIWLSRRAGILDDEGVPSSLMPGIFGYWVWLAREIGKSNIEVARHALAIDMRLSPTVIKIVSPTKTTAGLATFANSITLTPGTVTIDLEPDYMLVHGLTSDLADVDGINEMGRRVADLEHPSTDGSAS